MEKLEDVLSIYDNVEKKGFTYTDVSDALSKICEEGETKKLCNYEKMAFSFVEKTDRDKGEEYFSPIFSFRDSNGNIVDVPSKEEITLECIEYWQKRSNETHNPMIKARYVGLLFEYQEEKAHIKKEKVLIDSYIDSLLLSVEGNYPKHSIISILLLERSFELNHLRRGADTNRIKKALNKIETQSGDDAHSGIWARAFNLFLANKDLFTLGEQQGWVEKQYKRLDRLCSKSNNISLISDQVDILIQYWKKESNSLSIQKLLKQMYDYLQNEKDSLGAMKFVYWLENLQKKYSSASLKREADQLLMEIKENSPRILSEMRKFKFEKNIQEDYYIKLDKYLIGEGDCQKILERFTFFFIPIKRVKSEKLKDQASQVPLQYMFYTELYDENGRKIAGIKGIEQDFEGHLSKYYVENFICESYAMYKELIMLKERGVLSLENIKKFIFQSPYIRVNRQSIIERGIEAYLQEDYLVAIHLLIPQIEEAVRLILEMNGGVTVRFKNDAYQLKTFDDILRDPIMVNSMGEDICFYFQQIFTNVRGLNLRNDVCHGILVPEKFNFITADLVFHALLTLGLMKR